ncbi:hypothetical protein M378DRAFT_90297 [Amanita muscaria Koide BX008]|uniref:DDE Tnp4 domain-containing protein n=1 Tax=Amanita muscaria (strain Koide BX008) TaxID=946122 RepID=A0A0C2SP62_AMAMK|nr:hypothetical protein M378DRAFT_90297 [Amanita muscaria Koide BX008]
MRSQVTGWEGSAADARVYHDAIQSDLIIPEGCYYLADAGFPHGCRIPDLVPTFSYLVSFMRYLQNKHYLIR